MNAPWTIDADNDIVPATDTAAKRSRRRAKVTTIISEAYSYGRERKCQRVAFARRRI